MKKCCNPDHPHCTLWVIPGDDACGAGHAQAASSSYNLLNALRSTRPSNTGPGAPFIYPEATPVLQRPHLHISGFDPRAAGGRQAIKIELRGLPADSAPSVTVQLQSALIAHGASRHTFVRSLRGEWRPLFVEFSSRGKEHGQYQVDVELHSQHEGDILRKWVCTLLLLVPRADATLAEIHQVFLSTHKNVRVMADDASIAKVNATTGGGSVNIDVHARNAGIAHLNLDAAPGKVDLGFTSIAWDEDLIEIDVPAMPELHPFPRDAACIVNAAPEAGAQRQVRLFAMRECMLGRFEQVDPEADVLLTHFGDDGQDHEGLTRRLSGRHAVIRRGSIGFEIEDVSRYGMLIDGVWPGKCKPVLLRLGMRIELSASIKGIATFVVSALLPNGVILHRADQGEHAECFYFLEPERHPGFPLAAYPSMPRASVMPALFHLNGGFWHIDPATGRETALSPGVPLERLAQLPRHTRFSSDPYPEAFIERGVGSARAANRVPVQLTA
jgi:hypothetical protein